jgi:hypothetical protein
MALRHELGVFFEVFISERENLDNVTSKQEVIVYCTDGSRKDGLTAIGIYSLSVRHFEALCLEHESNDNKYLSIM